MMMSTFGAHAAGPKKGKVREYAEAFGVALVIALIVRTLFLQAFKIPSGSMENTLLVGDHIFVNKFIYGYHVPYTKGRILAFTTPKRGDIVVFVFPEDPSKDFIKRVIGTPGDVVEIRQKTVYINGAPLVEEYTRFADGKDTDGFLRGRDNMPPVRVPAGKTLHDGGQPRPIVRLPLLGVRRHGRRHREGAVHLLLHRLEPGDRMDGRDALPRARSLGSDRTCFALGGSFPLTLTLERDEGYHS